MIQMLDPRIKKADILTSSSITCAGCAAAVLDTYKTPAAGAFLLKNQTAKLLISGLALLPL